MGSFSGPLFLAFLPFCLITVNILSFASGKVFIVVMEDDPVITYKSSVKQPIDYAQKYKNKVISRHDIFLESLLPSGSYTKLYSYTHLINGFALHISSVEAIDVLRDARGIRIIQEDIRMVKMTTHTPDYLGISAGVWPVLEGPEHSGEGVVIGVIDTGINPSHPSFANLQPGRGPRSTKFKGKCEAGPDFPASACNRKIVGAQHFSRAAFAAGDFNGSFDYASPFDSDGHGSHTASTAAGNYNVAVVSNGYNYGFASGMAPGAHIAVYKAIFSFGGYMSDVVAAVDQAVEDGVDVLSLSIGPSSVPPGPASFLNILEMELLFATKAGVFVVQAVGNGGPGSSSILSFSPWIMSVAASTTDRNFSNSLVLAPGRSLPGTGLSPPTSGDHLYPLASARDVCNRTLTYESVQSCQRPEPFIPSLARRKIIICSYTADFEFTAAKLDSILDTIQIIGAAGFVFVMDRSLDPQPVGGNWPLRIPGIFLNTKEAAKALWDYYDSNTLRGVNGMVLRFSATARIGDGRNAIYTGKGPVIAAYSSRGPDVNNVLMQTADIMKPDVAAPGSSIWAAWSRRSHSNQYLRDQDFALMTGTSMATPHVAGIAALIKQKHPDWSPAAIASAIMTTADVTDSSGNPIQAQRSVTDVTDLSTATPFDFGSGFINPTNAMDPGLILDAEYKNYIQFLCAVPGVDDETVRRAVGKNCPTSKLDWASDLNTPSVTVANLVGSRKVLRKVTSVADHKEKFTAVVREPAGVGVRVRPQHFTINPNTSRVLRIDLVAREVTNAYEFGEVVLRGDHAHVVRIPVAVYVSSTLHGVGA